MYIIIILSNKINITVVYALPDKQFIIHLKLRAAACVKQAIIQSGILFLCEEIDLAKNKVGIDNKLVNLTDDLSDGDRIEIYRPLIANPIDIRRKILATKKKIIKKFNRRKGE